jgi:hypothetical protein
MIGVSLLLRFGPRPGEALPGEGPRAHAFETFDPGDEYDPGEDYDTPDD